MGARTRGDAQGLRDPILRRIRAARALRCPVFMRSTLFLLVAPVMLACNTNIGSQNGVAMQDTFALDLFGPPTDAINSPYVAGAKFDVDIVSTGVDTTGYRVTSSNQAVLRIDAPTSPSSLDFPAAAVGVGHATLSIVDAKGNVVHTHDVDVDEPDSVQLHSHGLMLAGLPDAQTQLSHVNVVDGGTAMLLVRYFKGSQELWGNGAVKIAATGPLDATTTASGFGDANDWIGISAYKTGGGQVTLTVGGSQLAVVPVDVVDQAAIAQVTLVAQGDSQAHTGDSLYVFARSTNAQGEDVYGGSYAWEINGVGAETAGLKTGYGMPADLFTYKYDSSQNETVTALLGGFNSSVSVHGKGGSVDSTAAVACSVTRGPGNAGAWGGLGLAIAAVVAAARRRRVTP